MKPTLLIERQLGASARAGDVVIDCCAGSGSTLIAADRLGMKARVVELEPRFVDVIVRRWQQFSGQQAKRESDGASMPALEVA
jgi:DNA modification methylase